ncbi:MAG: glycosyltransferase involved in cell wall biosynthesis [Ilumatobacter sp.]
MTDSTPRNRRIAAVLVSLRLDGGAEALMRTLIDELDGEPYDIELFALRQPAASVIADFEAQGVAVHVLSAARLIDPLRFLRFVRAVRRGHFDVLHTNLPPSNILGLICGTLLRIPVVVVLHNSETSADDHWYHGRLEHILVQRFAAQVIAVGEQTAVARRAMAPDATISVLPNAVSSSMPLEVDERDALRATLMTNPTGQLLLAVGRLTQQKAHEDMIAAFKLVLDRRDDVELVIAGRGRREPQLRRLVEELGLEDRVHLVGVRTDIRRVLRAADAFVMSSHWEGLPVALLEAMEAGLPVASTNVGDIPVVLNGGVGVLVPPGNSAALADAMIEVLALPRDQSGNANRRIVEERYSARTWALAMTQHYDAAIATRHGRKRRAIS